jgi:hypothetical protein
VYDVRQQAIDAEHQSFAERHIALLGHAGAIR